MTLLVAVFLAKQTATISMGSVCYRRHTDPKDLLTMWIPTKPLSSTPAPFPGILRKNHAGSTQAKSSLTYQKDRDLPLQVQLHWPHFFLACGEVQEHSRERLLSSLWPESRKHKGPGTDTPPHTHTHKATFPLSRYFQPGPAPKNLFSS